MKYHIEAVKEKSFAASIVLFLSVDGVLDDFSLLVDDFDLSKVAGPKAEMDVLIFRPSGEEDDVAFVIFLH